MSSLRVRLPGPEVLDETKINYSRSCINIVLSNIVFYVIVKYKASLNFIALLRVVHQCYNHYNHVHITW